MILFFLSPFSQKREHEPHVAYRETEARRELETHLSLGAVEGPWHPGPSSTPSFLMGSPPSPLSPA